MNDNLSPLDKKKKKQLNKRIFESIHHYKRKRRIAKISYIASFAIILAVGFFTLHYIDINQSSQIIRYTASIDHTNNSDNEVRLILADKEEIKITEENSSIVYSKNGETIDVNNTSRLDQSAGSGTDVSYNTIIVPYGKRSQIALSDGSKVWLNSGTKLTYPISFFEKRREVYLEGEAIFEVTHNENSPFHVLSRNYDVKVLGTVFNVSAYPDDEYINTALKSGSVEITYANDNHVFNKTNSIKIVPGTLATYFKKRKSIESKKVDIVSYMSWRDGVFIFKRNSLDYIMRKISRHYGVSIFIDNNTLKKQTFSGTLNINNDLEYVLKVIKETTDFEYKRINNQIIINQTE